MKQIHITQASKTGKLQGINSINTSTIDNEFCQKMINSTSENVICKNCYFKTMEKRYSNLHQAVLKNHVLLSTTRLDQKQLPVINANVFRVASGGEIINHTHALNIIDIINYNPNTLFAWWTKRDDIIRDILKDIEKPSNLILIYSSPIINKIAPLPKHFNKVFTAHYKTTNAEINCHGKCIDCMKCYSHNDITYINEFKK